MKDRYVSPRENGAEYFRLIWTRRKTRITIRLDQDIVDRFFEMSERSGGAMGYQTLIKAALREYLYGKAPKLEDTLRRIIREELKSSAA